MVRVDLLDRFIGLPACSLYRHQARPFHNVLVGSRKVDFNVLHMPELLRSPSPGQARPLNSSACRSHHFGTFPMRPPRLHTSTCIFTEVSSQENTFQNDSGSRTAARATCNLRLQPADLAKLRHRRLANRRRRIPPGHAHISYQDISKTCPGIPTMDNSQECQESRDKNLGLLSAVPGIGRYLYSRCLSCRARGRRVGD